MLYESTGWTFSVNQSELCIRFAKNDVAAAWFSDREYPGIEKPIWPWWSYFCAEERVESFQKFFDFRRRNI